MAKRKQSASVLRKPRSKKTDQKKFFTIVGVATLIVLLLLYLVYSSAG